MGETQSKQLEQQDGPIEIKFRPRPQNIGNENGTTHITPHQGSNIHLQIENTSSATPAFNVDDTTITNHANEQQIILLPKDTYREYNKQDNTPSAEMEYDQSSSFIDSNNSMSSSNTSLNNSSTNITGENGNGSRSKSTKFHTDDAFGIDSTIINPNQSILNQPSGVLVQSIKIHDNEGRKGMKKIIVNLPPKPFLQMMDPIIAAPICAQIQKHSWDLDNVCYQRQLKVGQAIEHLDYNIYQSNQLVEVARNDYSNFLHNLQDIDTVVTFSNTFTIKLAKMIVQLDELVVRLADLSVAARNPGTEQGQGEKIDEKIDEKIEASTDNPAVEDDPENLKQTTDQQIDIFDVFNMENAIVTSTNTAKDTNTNTNANTKNILGMTTETDVTSMESTKKENVTQPMSITTSTVKNVGSTGPKSNKNGKTGGIKIRTIWNIEKPIPMEIPPSSQFRFETFTEYQKRKKKE